MIFDNLATPERSYTKQHFEKIAPLLEGLLIPELDELAKLDDGKKLHDYFINTVNLSDKRSGLHKLIAAHSPCNLAELTDPISFYQLTTKLAQDVRNKTREQIHKKIRMLGKTQAMVIIYELADSVKRHMLFNTSKLSKPEGISDAIYPLIIKLSVRDAIKHLSFEPVSIDIFSSSFKNYLNIENLNSLKILFIKSGTSNFDQCEAQINYEIKTYGESNLLKNLKTEYLNFKKFEKLISKTVKSKNIEIRRDSSIYIKILGLKTNSPNFISETYMLSKKTDLEFNLNKIIKKSQRKKARNNSSRENIRVTVYIKKEIWDFLCSPLNPKKSKSVILNTLVKDFLREKEKIQSEFIKKATVPKKTKDSHQKTDFIIPINSHEKLTKTAKKYCITIQDLINALAQDSISRSTLFQIYQRGKIINSNMVTTTAQITPIASYDG